jgi:hypothetical protein
MYSLDILCEALSHLREVWRDGRLEELPILSHGVVNAVTVSPERMRNELTAVVSQRYFDAEFDRTLAQDVPPDELVLLRNLRRLMEDR